MYHVKISKIRYSSYFLTAVLATGFVIACSRRPDPVPQEVQQKYQKEAKALCLKTAECLSKTLKTDPERIKSDYCENLVFPLIGYSNSGLQPFKPVYYNPDHYKAYTECTELLLSKENCDDFRKAADSDPVCSILEFDSPS